MRLSENVTAWCFGLDVPLAVKGGQKLESSVGKSLTRMRKNKSQSGSGGHWALIDRDLALLEG